MILQRIHELWQWYVSSGLGSATISIPMVETLLVFAVLTVCLLFRFSRIGLIVAYVFVYRWCWAFRQQILPDNPNVYNLFTAGYLICGILVFTFAIVGMIRQKAVGE